MNEILTKLNNDSDGMLNYEYIANNIDSCFDILPQLVDNIIRIDVSGQFAASAARFLAAVNKDKFNPYISKLVEATISKDRERKYIPSLLPAIWGNDYSEHVNELREKDDNFRRIYKRLYPAMGM